MEHLHSGIFQITRPADVGSLVEARFELHHRRHFLVSRRGHQRWNDQGMFAGAVKRLLDRQDTIVFGRRLNERNHCIVGIERMMQQYIVTAQFFE